MLAGGYADCSMPHAPTGHGFTLWPARILGAVTGKAVPPPKPARDRVRRTFYLANQSLVMDGIENFGR